MRTCIQKAKCSIESRQNLLLTPHVAGKKVAKKAAPKRKGVKKTKKAAPKKKVVKKKKPAKKAGKKSKK